MTILLLPFAVFQVGDEVSAKLSRQLSRMLGRDLEAALKSHGVNIRYLSSRGSDKEGKTGLVATAELPSPGDLETIARMYGADHCVSGRFGLSDKEILIEGRLFDVAKHQEVYAKRFETYPTYYFDAVEEFKLRIVQILGIQLTDEERVVLFRRATDSWQAYLYFLLAEDDRYAATIGILPHDPRGVVTLYKEALSIDPTFAEAQRGLEHFLVLLIEHQRVPQVEIELLLNELAAHLSPQFREAIKEIL